ncbi:MAG: hypothetical protein KC620_25300, partial [Myxococcales bacterium]|nr:hypothetical protein [Myxococcales bacterium]
MRGTAFLLTMLALFARVAHAAPAVEAHVAAAERALGAGDIALAAVEHEQAFELDHQPGHLADAARVLAGEPARCEAAGATLARYFAACGADCAAGVKVQAEAEPRCSGALTVETVPAGAATDAPPRLWAGAHRVIATWPDGERRGAVVCVAPGQPATLRIDRGQPTAVPLTGAARGRAFAHQEAAFSHAAAGQGCAAAAEFAAAYAVVPEQGFLFNLGVAHALRPETCGAAVEAFDRFLAACGDCAQAADARVRRAEAASGCTGKLVVQVEPTGAEVRVNGAPMA